MRKILFAAALSISSVAFAQSQPPADDADAAATDGSQPSGETVDDQSQASGPQGITQQGTDPNGQATVPPGMNQPPQVSTGSPGMSSTMGGSNMAMAPRTAAGAYPPCSRTVTDGCIQTYERGVRRARRR
jgi:hypothetical protein